MRKIFFVICLLVFTQTHGFAEDDATNGPPSPHEIIGYWKLVSWPGTLQSMNKINPWPLPYQYFAFYADGQHISIMVSQEETPTPETFDFVKSTFKGKNPTYTWAQNFIIVTQPEIENYQEIWGMNIIRKSKPPLPMAEGDIIMSLAGGENGEAVYYRWLTRIK